MRKLALAAVLGCGLMLSGTAHAAPWNDPNGRVTFDAPRGWVMQVRGGGTQTVVVAGDANNECLVFAVPNANTTSASVPAVLRTINNDANYTDNTWLTFANSISQVFPNQSAQVNSLGKLEGDPWAVRTARLTSPERPVFGYMQLRPGFELMALCYSYGGADPAATFDAFARSIGHPNDATWEAQATAAPQPAPGQTPAPAPAPSN